MNDIFYAVFLGTLAAHTALFAFSLAFNIARPLWLARSMRLRMERMGALTSGPVPMPQILRDEKGRAIMMCPHCDGGFGPEGAAKQAGCVKCGGSGNIAIDWPRGA